MYLFCLKGIQEILRAQAANKICFELVYFAKTYLGADERNFLPVVTVVGQATVNSKFPM
jgi:hypothetical protein